MKLTTKLLNDNSILVEVCHEFPDGGLKDKYCDIFKNAIDIV